ncbi:hypothetical protein DM807_08165 [Pseudomonas hunanensis]|nr:hypothetical protein [Pseudomonas hunanensis]RNF70516.1 hypothetical protein EFJ98_13250 [Pseudomonas putida]
MVPSDCLLPSGHAVPVGAALCRDRAAKRPQDLSNDAHIAGAALQPDRDTRPLLQGIAPGLRGRG